MTAKKSSHWMIVSLLMVMIPPVAMVTISAQSATCGPPPEWGATKAFGKWGVTRACFPFGETLTAGSVSEAGGSGESFVFWCDLKPNIGAMVVLKRVQLDLPMSLTLKGGRVPAVKLEESVPVKGMTQVVLSDSPATKVFRAALVDGPEPTFTLVVTSTGKPPVEMTFSRTGLATAVKPLRRRCAW
jgi:hypothetical protein